MHVMYVMYVTYVMYVMYDNVCMSVYVYVYNAILYVRLPHC